MNSPVAVITGATGLTGSLAAHAFAERGASLALLSHDQQKLDALLSDLNLPAERAMTHKADLAHPGEVQAAGQAVLEKFGRADVLLHLVGGWTGGKTLVETPGADLEFMLSQHLWTTFNLIQAFMPSMQKNSYGRILIISSPLAVNPSAKMGAYAIGKVAEETLLLTVAQEGKESNVTANILHVRSIDAQNRGKGTPPKDLVAAMLYLCSADANKINGARIPLY